ncbi:OmpA family protein [Tenacibaculum sp. SG-28]|uniref:OmpA family protein n=1 Tax=Tenacibaculum sp. SG-28 TaxID=754426 RepID=UPI000CF5558C|nr:OmpA family protein [Tenacibaculum sp. SG-28]PQJ22887.1 hypothetical protein BSU00_00895 [Tenacibaculum sp. SG-28]
MKVVHLFLCCICCLGELFASDPIKFSIYFDTDSSSIVLQQQESLKKIIHDIAANSIQEIQIEAFCDDRGRAVYNQKLSLARAKSIKNILLSNWNIDSTVIKMSGKGEVSLENSSVLTVQKQRYENRRADVSIYITNAKDNQKVDDLELHTLDEGAVFTFHHILFEGGKSTLLQESKASLLALLHNMQRNPTYQIQIIGHIHLTDEKRKTIFDTKDIVTGNMLSEERSHVVYRYLIENGIAANRLSYLGKGGSEPLRKDPKYDRRVEFKVVKK